MKTITINGITFTSSPPKKPGWWLCVAPFTQNERDGAYPTEVLFCKERSALVAEAPEYDWYPVSQLTHLFWHELIPKQTVEAEANEAKEQIRLLKEQIRVADVAFNAQLEELKEVQSELAKTLKHFNQECPVCGSKELISTQP